MKITKSKLHEIQGVLVTANRGDLAKVFAKKNNWVQVDPALDTIYDLSSQFLSDYENYHKGVDMFETSEEKITVKSIKELKKETSGMLNDLIKLNNLVQKLDPYKLHVNTGGVSWEPAIKK